MRTGVIERPALRLLRRHVPGGRGRWLPVLVWSAVEAVPALASGWVVAQALDRGFLAHRADVGLALLGSLAALHVLRAVAQRALLGHFTDLVEPMRDSLVEEVVTAALSRAAGVRSSHNSAPDSATVARLTGQVEAMRGLTGALLRVSRPVAITVLAAVAGLFTLAPVLVAVVVPPLALVAVAYPLSVRALARRSRATALAEEAVAAETGRVMLAARDIAALGAEDQATAVVGEVAARHARAAVAHARVASVRVGLNTLGGRLPLVGLLALGPWLIDRGSVTVGALVGAVVYLSAQLIPALSTLTGLVSDYWTQLVTVATRLAETTAGSSDPAAPVTAVPGPRGTDLVVDGLGFAYGAGAAPVVRDLSFTVPAGDQLAIVGTSGIGKSTVAALLAGLDAPDTGTVRFGGVPVSTLAPAQRRRLIAMIPQQAYVFEGTLRENLGYLTDPDTSGATVGDDELDRAATATGCDELVARLGGYDAVLTDPGAELSAGERQLIALTRVLLGPARVVILDEATCHLDPVAEARAEAAFAGRPDGTLVVIAHRLSSARRARRVLFLYDRGADLGEHTDLLERCAPYADLVGTHRPVWAGSRRKPA